MCTIFFSRGSVVAVRGPKTYPLIRPLEVLSSPPYGGDNDRSYIPAAMKNGRECRLVRLEAVPGGFARVGSSRLSSRGDIRDGSAESAGTGKRVIVCISTNAAQRGAENARGMRFNSGAFPSSRVGFSCLCTYAHTAIQIRCYERRRRARPTIASLHARLESVFFHLTCKVFFDARKLSIPSAVPVATWRLSNLSVYSRERRRAFIVDRTPILLMLSDDVNRSSSHRDRFPFLLLRELSRSCNTKTLVARVNPTHDDPVSYSTK